MTENRPVYQNTFRNYLCLQRLSPKTMEAYLHAVSELSAFHKQAAETLTNDQIQDFLLYSIQDKKLAWSSCNVLFCGLKKFFKEFLGRSCVFHRKSATNSPRSRPLIVLHSGR